MSGTNLKDASSASKNKDNSNPKSGVTTCVLPECELKVLLIKELPSSGKKARGFVLDVTGKPTRGNEHVLQVISDHVDPTQLELKFPGTCVKGHPSTLPDAKMAKNPNRPNTAKACPTVDVSGPGTHVAQTNNMLIEVLPSIHVVKSDFAHADNMSFRMVLLKYLNPESMHPAVYRMQSMKCTGSGQYSALVEVFPRVEINGHFAFEYTPNKKPARKAHKDDDLPFLLEGSIGCNVDGQKWEIGGSTDSKTKGDKGDEFFKSGLKMLGGWLMKLTDMKDSNESPQIAGVKFKIESKVRLDLEAGAMASDSDYDIGAKGLVKLDCSPLIGAELHADIIDFIAKFNKVAAAIKRIREKIREGITTENFKAHGDLRIEITVGGEIKGNLTAKKDCGKLWESSGGIGGTVKIDFICVLNAEMEAKGGWLGFTAAMKSEIGGELGLGSADSKNGVKPCSVSGSVSFATVEVEAAPGAKKSSKVEVDGAIKFNGIALYGIVYVHMSGSLTTDKAAQSTKTSSKIKSQKTGKSHLDANGKLDGKWEGTLVLVDPWSWPPQESVALGQKSKAASLSAALT